MGSIMRNSVIPAILLSLICCRSVAAADCESYAGTRGDAAKEVTTVVGKALAAIKTHNAKGLFAISSSKLLLLRRVVSSGEDSRTGNIRLALRPRDVDAGLNINIGSQTFSEFSDQSLFNTVNTASVVSLQREVCEGARHCDDALPGSEEVPFLIKNLMQCNRSGGKDVYLFSDGMFVTDMQLSAGRVPVGSALFFTKQAGGYKLAGLIIQR
jgi:hypothetical protein